MPEPPRWRRYLRLFGPDVEGDIDDELGFHLAMRERDFLAAGLPPAAAREEALARFGEIDEVRRWLKRHDRRRQRHDRRVEMVSELAQDVRYGSRRLRQSPGFTAAVVLVLALGIGATTAIFSILDAALLRPLPYPEPERLVEVADVQWQGETSPSFPEFLDWQEQGGPALFSDLAASFVTRLALTGTGEPETLTGVAMSASLPRLLGVAPRAGRAFLPGEDEPAAPRVAMLSEELWKRRFGASPEVLGRSITLAGEPYTVIGILPTGGRAVLPSLLARGRAVDLWIPLRLDAKAAPRGLHFLDVVGRLAPGLSRVQAERQVAALAKRLQTAKVTDHGIHIAPLERQVVGDSRPLLLSLAGAVAMVLAIACTNVASLLLARGAARRREIAIRLALGAARGRIVRQLVVETLLLALLGGAAGVLVARAGVAGLAILGPLVPRLGEATVDGRILAFAFALSLATGLLCGLLPAFLAARRDLSAVMKTGAPGALGGPARDRLRGALIVAEVALSFALLLGAGLLLRSLTRLLAVDKGFAAEHVVSAHLSLPPGRYPDGPRQAAFFGTLRERLAALPGAQGAAFVNLLPLQGRVDGDIGIEGRTFPPEAPAIAEKRIVSPGYFAVLQTPVVLGRAIDERDVAGAPPVVVVNQAFARHFFPGESPLGKRVDFAWDTEGLQQIVGVAADVREQDLTEPAHPAIYMPLAQRPMNDMYLMVRAAGDPVRLIPPVREAVRALDRDQPVAEARPLAEVVDARLAERRFALALFAVFSALALVLAAVGLYAVVSYSVERRRPEIGIQMALGARPAHVTRAILGQGLALIAAGTALGALAALGLGRFLAGLVYGVGTADPATFAGVAVLLLATALAASTAPALRATRVDPARVLRGE